MGLELQPNDTALEERIRTMALTGGISLQDAILRLLRQGAGMASREDRLIGSRLDHLSGSWSEAEYAEFEAAVASLSEVDQDVSET